MNTFLENARKMIAGELPPPPVGTLVGFRILSIDIGRGASRRERVVVQRGRTWAWPNAR
jgi:hypothetical protein